MQPLDEQGAGGVGHQERGAGQAESAPALRHVARAARDALLQRDEAVGGLLQGGGDRRVGGRGDGADVAVVWPLPAVVTR